MILEDVMEILMIEPVCWVAVCEAVRENLRKSCFWQSFFAVNPNGLVWWNLESHYFCLYVHLRVVQIKQRRCFFSQEQFQDFDLDRCLFYLIALPQGAPRAHLNLKIKTIILTSRFPTKKRKKGLQIILSHLGLDLLASWPPPLLRLHLSRLETTWAVEYFFSIDMWQWCNPHHLQDHHYNHDRQRGPRSLL